MSTELASRESIVSLKAANDEAMRRLRESHEKRKVALRIRSQTPPWVFFPQTHRDWQAILPVIRLALLDLIVGRAPWPLLLVGETGAGKTCTALCLHDYFGGWYTTLAELHATRNEVLQERVFWRGESTSIPVRVSDFWGSWERSGLCTIDEIGVRQPTEAAYETFKAALDRREQKPLIVVSNLNEDEINDLYDDRIASRLVAGTKIEMCGDRRLEQARGLSNDEAEAD